MKFVYMVWNRIAISVVASCLAVWLAACGQIGAPGPRPSPFPSATTLNYSALGASDALGTGASIPCATGGTPPMPSPPNCPGGTGYVPDIARLLTSPHTSVTLVDLGISGAVIGPDIQSLGNAHRHNVPGNFLQNELPKLPANTTTVTIFTGGDDTLTIFFAVLDGAGGADIPGFIAAQTQAFGNDYSMLNAGIKTKAPSAKIVVADVPNLAGLPFAAILPTSQKQLLQQISVGLDLNVINPLAAQGIPVIDLLCDSRTYDAGNLSIDGYHPNDSGYAILASLMVTALTSPSYPAPQTNCPQMTLVRNSGHIR